MPARIDISRVAAEALARAESLLNSWFPAGRRQGREWVLGGLDGSKGRSLSINLDRGSWADFATGDKGGDLVSLLAARDRINQLEAARAIVADLALPESAIADRAGPAHDPRPKSAPAAAEYQPIMPVDPAPNPEPGLKHFEHGEAVMRWRYLDAEGRLLHYVARYEPPGKSKQIIPWTFGPDKQGRTRWQMRHAPAPRPLYGLEHLARSPDAPVIIVEGEKAADAARRIMGDRVVVVTWSGGGSAVHKADWSPLAGRRCLIWPDDDQPGIKAADNVTAALMQVGSRSCSVIAVDGIARDGGWDLADAEAEGWDAEQVLERLSAAQEPAELYRLPELKEAPEDAFVLFVATEAAADRAASLGLLATTVPRGAGEWRDCYADQIRDVRVVAIAGGGEPAEERMAAVVTSFRQRGVPATVLRLDGLPIGGDLTDWLDAGGTPDRLLALAEAEFDAPAQERPRGDAAQESNRERGRLIDPKAPLGVARRLHDDVFGPTLRFWRGDFLRWTDGAYHPMENAAIRREIYLYLDGASCADGNPIVPKPRLVSDVLDALGTVCCYLSGDTEPPAWLDPAPGAPDPRNVIPVSNGILDPSSGVLLDHTPNFFNLGALPVKFVRDAPAPENWRRFLADVWPDDTEARDTLQEFFGYAMTADTSQQKILLIVGPKRSGKGTIARVLTAILGHGNVAAPTLAALASNFGLAPLIGKRLAIISDARLSSRADQATIAERLLSISGEDALTIDRKHRDAWTGRLVTRFAIMTNELPKLGDASGALASRFCVLTMDRSFYGAEDHGLTDRLMGELPGILERLPSAVNR